MRGFPHTKRGSLPTRLAGRPPLVTNFMAIRDTAGRHGWLEFDYTPGLVTSLPQGTPTVLNLQNFHHEPDNNIATMPGVVDWVVGGAVPESTATLTGLLSLGLLAPGRRRR